MKGKLSAIVVLPLLCICAVLICSGQSRAPNRVVANGIEFTYIEKGQGEPLILLHGGIGDYRSWDQQIDSFAAKYRVISYSRRYNYPNKNEYKAGYKGALTDADDLAVFIRKLGLKKVHLVGLSYGALTALILAVKNPDVALSLVLAEPPAHQLIRDSPEGDVLYRQFLAESKPVAEAFRAGDDRLAIRLFNRKMGRDFEKLSPPVAEMMLQNALALKAINFADEPFPAISKAKLRRLKTPTLIQTGEKTIEIHRAVDIELARLLPNAKSVIVPNAGHSIPRDNPEYFNSTVIGFLSTRSIAADSKVN